MLHELSSLTFVEAFSFSNEIRKNLWRHSIKSVSTSDHLISNTLPIAWPVLYLLVLNIYRRPYVGPWWDSSYKIFKALHAKSRWIGSRIKIQFDDKRSDSFDEARSEPKVQIWSKDPVEGKKNSKTVNTALVLSQSPMTPILNYCDIIDTLWLWCVHCDMDNHPFKSYGVIPTIPLLYLLLMS